jgi:hypothetical protein
MMSQGIGPRLRAVTCLATTSRNLTFPIIITIAVQRVIAVSWNSETNGLKRTFGE